MRRSAVVFGAISLFAACATDELPRFSDPRSAHDQIVICGKRVSIGVPVVLWTDPGGYDATSEELHFAEDPSRAGDPPSGLRYTPGRTEKLADGSRRTRIEPFEIDGDVLAEVVDQFVLHYDACGLSQTCFRVLHDIRGLSVHFMLDLDGTLYQTLDLRDQAWHAGKANYRSIGVEIAHPGAFSDDADPALTRWYAMDEEGVYLVLPEDPGHNGLRAPGFVPRPSTEAPVLGEVQGKELVQFDFTPEQYDTLVKLAAALCRLFPGIEPVVPRGADGRIASRVLGDDEYRAFQGILGHHHVSHRKTDPGPAFNWNAWLSRVQNELRAGK